MEDAVASANDINITEFKDILIRYNETIKNLDLDKPGKEGSQRLEDLDHYRFIEAPSRFSKKTGAKSIGLVQLQKLMEWKLRHGVNRPFLPALIRKNLDETVQEITSSAFATHTNNPDDIIPTLTKISQLKGVGPATASLVLSIHDPKNIIFFSDEAYAWVVSDSTQKPDIKYTFKEYKELYAKSKALMARLKVSPMDIEKVAYVLAKEAKPEVTTKGAKFPTRNPKSSKEDLGVIDPDTEATKRGRGRPQGSKNKELPVDNAVPTESRSRRTSKRTSTSPEDHSADQTQKITQKKRKASEAVVTTHGEKGRAKKKAKN